MKVLYHHRTQAEDAQGIHIFEMIKSLRGLGHEIREVSLVQRDLESDASPSAGIFGAISVAVPRFGYELLELLYNAVGFQRLSKAIREFKPDFIYERYALHNFAGIWASRRHKIPLLLEVNSPLALERSEDLAFRRLARRTESWICSNASRTICVSNELGRILTQSGVPGHKIEICHNGVDPEKFHGRKTGGEIRARYGLAGKTVLGFVGWVRKWHGVSELIPCLKKWQERGVNVSLLIVGDGPARPAIEIAAKESGVQDIVRITGAVKRTEVVDHIAALDVALQPAATLYASPMKIFEYLAMGKPVVAPRQTNILEILSEGRNAKLFRPGEPLDMMRAVDELLATPSLIRRMGAEARRTVFERRFLWTENAQRAIRMAKELRERS